MQAARPSAALGFSLPPAPSAPWARSTLPSARRTPVREAGLEADLFEDGRAGRPPEEGLARERHLIRGFIDGEDPASDGELGVDQNLVAAAGKKHEPNLVVLENRGRQDGDGPPFDIPTIVIWLGGTPAASKTRTSPSVLCAYWRGSALGGRTSLMTWRPCSASVARIASTS